MGALTVDNRPSLPSRPVAENAQSKPLPGTSFRATPSPGTLTRLALLLATVSLAAVVLSGDSLGAHGQGPMTEVVVTLRAPSMAAFGRSLQSASHRLYMRQVDAAQTALAMRITTALPEAQIRWRYHLVADGMAVYLPRSQAALLTRVPGVARVPR